MVQAVDVAARTLSQTGPGENRFDDQSGLGTARDANYFGVMETA